LTSTGVLRLAGTCQHLTGTKQLPRPVVGDLGLRFETMELPAAPSLTSAWSEDRIWAELQKRVDGPDGLTLQQGRIFDTSVLKFRSYVGEPMRYGNLFLAGDAGHTVPPTGAKGLNLAFADVRVLFEGIESWAATGSRDLLDRYSQRALDRVWRAQHVSYWMASMLHTRPGANPSTTSANSANSPPS
jgi:2-polyprenyl-6-methoxyphenol hydroxylase-like FAD-dependent oxidoreductase